MASNSGIQAPASGSGAPNSPRRTNIPVAIARPGAQGTVRKLNDEELRSWTRAIHRACAPGWVPALRYAFANLMPFVDEGCSTAYTDCHFRVGLSPALLDPDKTTDEQLALAVLHETLHNVQQHARRFEGMDVPALVKNYVTDLEINSVLAAGVCNIDLGAPIQTGNTRVHWDWLLGEVGQIESQEEADAYNTRTGNNKRPAKVGDAYYQGIVLPCTGVFWDIPAGLTAEQYLSIIDYEFTKITPADRADASDADGAQAGQSTDARTSIHIYQRHQDGSETTIAHADDWVDSIYSDADLDGWSKVDELGIHPMDRGLENEVRDRLVHDIAEQQRGGLPGNKSVQAVLNYVNQALRPPVVNWHKILRQVARKVTQEITAGRQDYTYQKRRRRSGGPVLGLPNPVEAIYPGQAAYLPRIRFAIDTSGSMSKAEYRKVLSEIDGILREFSGSIEIVCIDARAGKIFEVKSVEEIGPQLTGGGGTDMSMALQQVAEQKKRERPDVLIIASDGKFWWNKFCKALAMKELEGTAVVLLCVYPFAHEAYYREQGSMADKAREMKRCKRDSYFVQAWID